MAKPDEILHNLLTKQATALSKDKQIPFEEAAHQVAKDSGAAYDQGTGMFAAPAGTAPAAAATADVPLGKDPEVKAAVIGAIKGDKTHKTGDLGPSAAQVADKAATADFFNQAHARQQSMAKGLSEGQTSFVAGQGFVQAQKDADGNLVAVSTTGNVQLKGSDTGTVTGVTPGATTLPQMSKTDRMVADLRYGTPAALAAKPNSAPAPEAAPVVEGTVSIPDNEKTTAQKNADKVTAGLTATSEVPASAAPGQYVPPFPTGGVGEQGAEKKKDAVPSVDFAAAEKASGIGEAPNPVAAALNQPFLGTYTRDAGSVAQNLANPRGPGIWNSNPQQFHLEKTGVSRKGEIATKEVAGPAAVADGLSAGDRRAKVGPESGAAYDAQQLEQYAPTFTDAHGAVYYGDTGRKMAAENNKALVAQLNAPSTSPVIDPMKPLGDDPIIAALNKPGYASGAARRSY